MTWQQTQGLFNGFELKQARLLRVELEPFQMVAVATLTLDESDG